MDQIVEVKRILEMHPLTEDGVKFSFFKRWCALCTSCFLPSWQVSVCDFLLKGCLKDPS